MFLDDSYTYQEIRNQGRRSTWQEIKVSRKRLQRFISRQSEYKKTFDMMLSYYKQFKSSLEQIEEFWMFLHESIYG